MGKTVSQDALDILFNEARTFSHWQEKPVAPEVLRKLYDLVKMAPTSANCSPMRVVFVASPAEKELLKGFVDKGNIEKTMGAPVTAIIAHDMEFYEQLPKLYPHADARSWFAGKPEKIESTAFRNGTLQGGYLILAARALGLDCGPMSGFSNAKLDAHFFAGTPYKSNFLCNLGYGDPKGLHPRSPRLGFEEACKIV